LQVKLNNGRKPRPTPNAWFCLLLKKSQDTVHFKAPKNSIREKAIKWINKTFCQDFDTSDDG